MTIDSAHRSKWQIGEVVFGIPFILSIGIQWVIPFSLPQGILRQVGLVVGILLIITGIVIVIMARRELTRFNQPTDPSQSTSKIISTGIFSISRNPLYLGAAILFFGIALMINSIWALIALLLSIVVCHHVLIIPEEQYLSAKFGDAYIEYTNTVRRWAGRKGHNKPKNT